MQSKASVKWNEGNEGEGASKGSRDHNRPEVGEIREEGRKKGKEEEREERANQGREERRYITQQRRRRRRVVFFFSRVFQAVFPVLHCTEIGLGRRGESKRLMTRAKKKKKKAKKEVQHGLDLLPSRE